MHLLSSTATFRLASPLPRTTLYITDINATAYHHSAERGTDDCVGTIAYHLPFAVPPGVSESPRLPVAWSLSSVGYDAVRQALGGRLTLAARATVGVRVGSFEETVWFVGRGIGASVRL